MPREARRVPALQVPRPVVLGMEEVMAVMSPKELREEAESQSPTRQKSRTKLKEEEDDPLRECSVTDSLTGTVSLLPALPMAKAYPQNFQQTMAFSKPSRWPFWFEQEQWEASSDSEEEEEEVPKKSQKTPRRSRPNTTERKKAKKLPPDYLSPFALEVRSMGADVVVTGQKLDRLKKKPDKPKWEEPEEAPRKPGRRRPVAAATPEAPKEPPEPEPTKPSPPPAKAPVPLKERPAWRSVAKSDDPWRKKEERGHKAGKKGSADSRRGQKDLPRSESAPALQSHTRRSSSNSMQEPQAPLTRGHAELWNKSHKLSAVRDLLDGYAADPISAHVLHRSSSAAADDGADPSPSASFLAQYVERQAEIERMLNEKAVPLVERKKAPE